MLDKIQQYMSNKWIMSMLFVGENIIKKDHENNEQIFNELFSTESLKYISYLLNNKNHIQILDNDKLKSLKEIISLYLIKNKEIDSEKEELIYDILEKINNIKFINTNKFYKLQYEIRNEKKCPKLTKEIKEKIDINIINDSKYLFYISKCLNDEFPDFIINDIEYLKSLMIFIEECPEMMKIPSLASYIRTTLKLNEQYENEELIRLNESLNSYFDENQAREYEISTQIMKQSIFSLMFNENMNEVIKELKENEQAEDFFTPYIFDIVKEFIQKNRKVCMFDKKIIKNIRELVITFYDLGVITNSELNEMKISLNVFINEEYENKNKEFYINMFNELNTKYITVVDFKQFKNTVNLLISNMENIVSSIIDFEIPSSSIAQDDYISLYINFILNNYPLISEEIVYLDRMNDILKYNEEFIEQTSGMKQRICAENNYNLQKKIKKLQR